MGLVSDMADIDAELLEELGEGFDFGGPTPINGIFNDSFITQPAGENVVEGRSIIFTCREQDLPSDLVEQTIVTRSLDSVQYRYLARSDADEAGLTVVRLGSL